MEPACMGIFDYFKRQGGKKKKETISESASRPRFAHYLFAHLVLRQVAMENPYICMGILGSPEGINYLGNLLELVEQYCEQQEEIWRLSADEIRITTAKVKRYPCLIVTLPEPQAVPE